MESSRRIRIVLYTRQPFVAQGMAAVLPAHPDFHLLGSDDSLSGTLARIQLERPDIVVVYPVSCVSLAELRQIRGACDSSHVVLWGRDAGSETAIQAMRLGVRAILPANLSIPEFLTSLRNVHRGVLCFGKDAWESASRARMGLTPRQEETVEMVAQGFRNCEIAQTLGVTEATVAAYLREISKKLGVKGRLELALYGRRNMDPGPALERIRPALPQAPPTLRTGVPHGLIVMTRRPSEAPVVQ